MFGPCAVDVALKLYAVFRIPLAKVVPVFLGINEALEIAGSVNIQTSFLSQITHGT